MKITPLEIRQKTFEKAFRGVDKDEVQAFLLTLSQQWERMNDENKDLKIKLEVATREVQKMREVESSLYKTLKTAEDTSASIQDQANKSADLKIREAQLQADQLLNDARQKARHLIEDAYKQSEKAIMEMQQEVKFLEQEHQRMETYVENLVRDLKNLATDALDKVEKSQAKPKHSLSGIMSRAANIKVQEIEMDKELFRDMPTKAPAENTPKVNTYRTPENVPAGNNFRMSGGGSEEAIPDSPKENPQPARAPEHTPSTAPGTTPEREQPTRPQEPQPLEPVIEPEILPSTKPEPSTNPATPEVTPPKPEVPQPETPVPNIPGPEVEQPEKDIPRIPRPEIERPAPEITPMPSTPEIQPPLTNPNTGPVAKKEKAMAETSFFDDL